jgi:hypothetical protein
MGAGGFSNAGRTINRGFAGGAMEDAAYGIDAAGRMYGQVGAAGPALQGRSPTIAGLMDRYQNPYTNQVINRTRNNMMDTMDQNLDQVGAAATRAGAFGGGRHGLVEATTRTDAMRDIGDMTAQLRQQGFDTAAGLAGQDVNNILGVRAANQNSRNQMWDRRLNAAAGAANTAQTSYGMGTNIMDRQQQQGMMAQQLQQAIMQAGQDMFGQYTAQPEKLLEMRLKSLGMNPMNAATTSTQTSNPGWGAMFGNLIGAAGNMLQFSPIPWPSARRFKTDIRETGRMVRSKAGNLTPEVSFRYRPETGLPEGVFIGIVAEQLGNDPAIHRDQYGRPERVDYSQLEIV